MCIRSTKNFVSPIMPIDARADRRMCADALSVATIVDTVSVSSREISRIVATRILTISSGEVTSKDIGR